MIHRFAAFTFQKASELFCASSSAALSAAISPTAVRGETQRHITLLGLTLSPKDVRSDFKPLTLTCKWDETGSDLIGDRNEQPILEDDC